MGLEPGPSKEGSWMMAQNDLIVVGIDVAKDKVDACIRSLSLQGTFPSSAEGRRKLIAWLRRHKVGKAPWRPVAAMNGTGPRHCARPASRSGSTIRSECA